MSGCDWCDEIGADETPWHAQRHEAHRAFHDFRRAVRVHMIEPWALPVVEWLDRRPPSGRLTNR